ncbi:Relaxin receptor 2 [Nymphon striatum]|nr:Relaxin receptor 2 [Nymphon striatum]
MSQEGNQGPTGTTKKPMRRLQRSMDARLWSRCCMASVITFEFLEDNTLNDSSISVLADVSAIRWLRLSENKLQLRNISFPELKNLTFLHMDNNFIESIDGQTFSSLKSLRVLKLDNNPIKMLPKTVFDSVKNLQSLYLRDMEISNLAIRTFKETEKLKIIHFKKFRYCSFAPHVRICEPRTDGLSSTEHLLVKPILRVCVWVVAAVTCIGNFLVLLGRFLATHDEPGRMSMMFIKNLSFADLLMGIYLCVVASKDIMFRDNYMKYAHEWMSSHWCVCCGILAMTASEVSVLTLSFMSIERHFRIVNPFRVLELHQRSAYISMILIWGSGITLAIIPTIPWMHQRDRHNFYGNNGLCFPLHISDPFIPGWQYSAFIFFGINFMGVLIIAITYISMYISIQHTRSKTPQRTGELEVAKRFFLIILTNCLCWIPIIILKLLALTGVKISEAFKDQHYLNYEISWPRDNMKFHEVSNLWYYMSLDDVINDLHAWIVIFILPVNSAMNPIIYTLSSKEFKKKVKTFANKSRLFWWLPSRRSTIRSERSMSSTRTMSTRTSSGFGSVRIVAKREMGVKLAAAGPRRHTTHIPAISEDFI